MKKYFNKRILKFLIFVFIMGIFFGFIFKFYLTDNDLLIIKSEINDYFNLLSSNNADLNSNLFNNFLYNSFLLTIIFISGIIFILLPLTLFIIFTKGFSMSFLLTAFYSLFKFKGIIYGFIIIFPFQIITIYILIMATYYSITIGKKMIRYFFYKENIDIRKVLLSYFKIFLILSIFLLISNILEVYILPFIIKLIV